MTIKQWIDWLHAGEHTEEMHTKIPQMTLSEARSLLQACFDQCSFSDHTKTIQLLLESHPGIAWSVDPTSLNSPLTADSSKLQLKYLRQVISFFPNSFLPQIRGAVAAVSQQMRAPMSADDKKFNTRLIAHFASCLCGINMAEHYQQEHKTYYAHLMRLEGAESFSELLGWDEKDFLPLRIHAHFERLAYLVSGFGKGSSEENRAEMTALEKLIHQELRSYLLACLIACTQEAVDEITNDVDSSSSDKRSAKTAACGKSLYLVMEHIKNLQPGESFSLETGWSTHSIYVEFRCLQETKNIEIILHNRNPRSRSLGVVYDPKNIDRYVEYFLKYRFGLVRDSDKVFYQKLSNKTNLFQPDINDGPGPVILPKQRVDNCVVASHDSVVANACGEIMYDGLKKSELNLLRSELRHQALMSELFQDDFNAIQIDPVEELRPNHQSFRQMKLNKAWKNPSKKHYQQLTPADSQGLKGHILRLCRRQFKKDWQYVSMVERLIYFDSLSDQTVELMLKTVEKYENQDTSRMLSAVLKHAASNAGGLPECIYQRCLKLVRSYFNSYLKSVNNNYRDVPGHRNSYTFFRHSNLFLESHPELLEEAVAYANVIDDPPDEFYHYGVVRMYARAWSTHRSTVIEALRNALISSDEHKKLGAIKIIGGNKWVVDPDTELGKAIRDAENDTGVDCAAFPALDDPFDFCAVVDENYEAKEIASLKKNIEFLIKSNAVTKLEELFFEFLDWGDTGRGIRGMLDFLSHKMVDEKPEALKGFIRKAVFSSETCVCFPLGIAGVKRPQHPNLKYCYEQVVKLVQKHFEDDKIFIKSLFKQAEKKGMTTSYTAAVLAKLNHRRGWKLYKKCLMSKAKNTEALLSWLAKYSPAKPKKRKVGRDGVFCCVKPNEGMPKESRELMRRHASSFGWSMLAVKKIRPNPADNRVDTLLSPRHFS